LPHLKAFSDKYDPDQVAVILVDVRNLKELTQKMAADSSLTMPVLLDGDDVSGDMYGVYATPTTFIVDQAGRAIFKHIGYGEGQEVMLEAEIELLLERGTT
jgi:hypothetical protein